MLYDTEHETEHIGIVTVARSFYGDLIRKK